MISALPHCCSFVWEITGGLPLQMASNAECVGLTYSCTCRSKRREKRSKGFCSYCISTQPMRNDVSFLRRLSLAGRIHERTLDIHQNQKTETLESTWIRNRPDTFVSDRCIIDQSHRYGRPQAACREPAGSYDKTTRTAICFEHKTQYLLIRAPYTRIVVFWHISNTPPMILQSQISCNAPTFYIAVIFVKYCYTTGSWLL